MKAPRVQFGVITHDYERSVRLYRDILGFKMHPPSNPIAMFDLPPDGSVVFSVCHHDSSNDLLGFDLAGVRTEGIVITVFYESEDARELVLRDLRGDDSISGISTSSGAEIFTDFNGVRWVLFAKPAP